MYLPYGELHNWHHRREVHRKARSLSLNTYSSSSVHLCMYVSTDPGVYTHPYNMDLCTLLHAHTHDAYIVTKFLGRVITFSIPTNLGYAYRL